MNKYLLGWFLLAIMMNLSKSIAAQDQAHFEKFAKVQAVFNAKCVSCHSSEQAPMGLSLEAGYSYRNLVNNASIEDPSLKRIMPNNVSDSYLYRKIIRDQEQLPFKDEGMPLDDEKLSKDEINVIENWIQSFPTNIWGEIAESNSEISPSSNESSEAFLATQLINLPTTRVLSSKTAEFRILHRFAVSNGGGSNTLGSFFGLDNGAITSINLSVGLNKNTDILVRRSGENKDVEVAVKHVPIQQSGNMPLSIGIYTGFNWISRSDVNAKHRFSPNVQLLAASRINNRFSILAAPSIAFRSNHNARIIKQINDTTFQNYKDSRATFAIGLGAQYQLMKDFALTAEYIPRMGGYKGNDFADDRRYDTWSLGLAYKVRLHVFQLLISNSQSIHTTQYIPGSSTKPVPFNKLTTKDPAVHLGFNIYRQFKW
ncbi:hypothetical protein F9K33_05580 [bacterium]|nr:MAG: hypothetical protein F9K33_05580 [bacterium]